MSTRNEVYKLLAINTEINDIVDILQVSRRTVERYVKEYKETLATSDKKATTTSDKRKRKEIARAQIEAGASLKEVAAQTNTSIDSLKRLSSREKLQEKQADFLRRFREEHKAKIQANKRERFYANSEKLSIIKKEIEEGQFNRNLQIALLENEKTEQQIFELDRLERLERLEFEKEKYKNERMLAVVEKIEALNDDCLDQLEEFLEQLVK